MGEAIESCSWGGVLGRRIRGSWEDQTVLGGTFGVFCGFFTLPLPFRGHGVHPLFVQQHGLPIADLVLLVCQSARAAHGLTPFWSLSGPRRTTPRQRGLFTLIRWHDSLWL